jgi:acyl-CoA reductase-like NAD-dependent aldehyde dehydrogenase
MILRYYAELAESVVVEEDRGSSLVRREPIGVAAMITRILVSATSPSPALSPVAAAWVPYAASR